MLIRDEDVFEYHEKPRPGKLEVVTSKPCFTQRDLSLAYTPGVARASLAIADDPDAAYRLTGRGNLVAVVSNGTAVLGLGDIDGELNVETALVEEVAREHFPHSQIQGDANVLIFPDLAAGNIGYKIAQRLGKADMVGPILMGMRRPVNVLPPGATAADIVNVTAITAVAAEMETEMRPAPVGLLEQAGV